MLGTRFLTAVILISLVLAALFSLAPVGWGTLSLVVMGLAASEWANLAGYARSARTLYVAATLATGIIVLVMLLRPEGLIPSKRRARELHEAEPHDTPLYDLQHEGA